MSPDGKYLASCGGGGGAVQAWDVESGQRLYGIKVDSYSRGICFSPDGKGLACLTDKVSIWNTEKYLPPGKTVVIAEGVSSGGHKREFKHTLGWIGSDGKINSFCFSPDSKRMVLIYEAAVNVEHTTYGDAGFNHLALNGNPRGVISAAFSADGKRLVTGSEDKTAQIWDASSGRALVTLRGHSDKVYSVCFSPDGKRVASGSGDKTVKIWDVENGLELLTLKGHNNPVTSVCFSPDGMRLTSGSNGDEVYDTPGTGRQPGSKGGEVIIWDASIALSRVAASNE